MAVPIPLIQFRLQQQHISSNERGQRLTAVVQHHASNEPAPHPKQIHGPARQESCNPNQPTGQPLNRASKIARHSDHRPQQLCVLATRSNSHRMQIPTVTAAWHE
ncbi:hypothetical protein ACLOJK_037202 [Asimina triloba]